MGRCTLKCTVGVLLALIVPRTSSLAFGTKGWVPKTVPLLESVAQHVVVDDDFALNAEGGVVSEARKLFDDTHSAADRSATEQNFMWEYWNAGNGQYNHLRTPAGAYFPPEIYGRLCDLITTFGQEQVQ